MNYIENLRQQKEKLRREIQKCNEKDFSGLVYKYNFYNSIENIVENGVFETEVYQEILSNKNIYDILYNKFLDWIDAPNLIDEITLNSFLQEIENEVNEEERIGEV